MLLEPLPVNSTCCRLTFGFAGQDWELNNYFRLRAEIFCKEQGIFKDTDKDAIDQEALPIISTTECMGMPDQVVGVVRIHQETPAHWFGGRLGVRKEYRSLRNYESLHLFHNDVAVRPFTMTIGAGLIFKAVTTAMNIGCKQFRAYVQHQNVKFFERLHWNSLQPVMLHQVLHHLMEADLNYYPKYA